MRDLEAITAWIDESEVLIQNKKHHLIGILITDSFSEEEKLSLNLIKLRKKHSAWHTVHGSNLENPASQHSDRIYKLIEDWIKLFLESENVCFHMFCYPENRRFSGDSFENYFAKQSVFGLANKMKESGVGIQTLFKNVRTVKILFDNRDDDKVSGTGAGYKEKICEQLALQSKRSDITTRFSFVSSECFNCIQLSDILLYMSKLKIEEEEGIGLSEKQKTILNIWKKYFTDQRYINISDYTYDEKFNYFLSKPRTNH
jgi:hypothetical protein